MGQQNKGGNFSYKLRTSFLPLVVLPICVELSDNIDVGLIKHVENYIRKSIHYKSSDFLLIADGISFGTIGNSCFCCVKCIHESPLLSLLVDLIPRI